MTAAERPLAVIGGGWAGLAAALELAQRGRRVLLLEAAPHLGGRARALAFGEDTVDNGQHLLIGAYREFLRLLRRIGVAEHDVLLRLPLRLDLDGRHGPIRLRAPRLPAPLHLAAALARADGLSARHRLAALAFATRLTRCRVEPDRSVSEWLESERQHPHLRTTLWEPLCLATLNTPARHASARSFITVLRDSFTRRRTDSDLLIPRRDLGSLLPEPTRRFLARHGGEVRTRSRVEALIIDDGRLQAVRVGDADLPVAGAVLAAAAPGAARLLAPHPALAATAARIAALAHEPIATVWLRYPTDTALAYPLAGSYDGLTQWLFDRRVCGQPGVMAAVISGPGAHERMPREGLADAVAAELGARYGWPAPRASLVVRERRATFRCAVGSDALRPQAATPVAGLWLAGDYTATGYPATLEGAVRSGVQCASFIEPNSDPR